MGRSGGRRSGLARQLARSAGGLLLAIALLESALQLGALALRWLSPDPAREAAESLAGADEYRVLCLGESTTEGFGETAYPQILAEELNRRGRGVRFRVINAGRSAADSTLLAEALPRFLTLYRPHMVIAMLGINDQFYFGDSEALGIPVGVQLWLLKSRVYKLATLLGSNLRALAGRGRPRALEAAEQKAWEAHSGEFERVWALWSKGELEDPERRFAALIARARAAAGPGLRLPDAYLRAYYNSHLALARHFLSTGRGERAVALYEEAIALHPEKEFFSRALSGVHGELGQTALAERFRERSRELAGRQVLEVTRANFAKIRQLLASQGIAFVAMQYPLRSVETLRFLLGEASDAIYVDNDALFRAAIEREGYDALFIDRVAGDFGHGTERGNRLIAENLIATVFEPLFAGRLD